MRTEFAVTRHSKAGIVHRRFPGLRRALCGVRVHGTLSVPGDRRPCSRCESFAS